MMLDRSLPLHEKLVQKLEGTGNSKAAAAAAPATAPVATVAVDL
jgi:hypothetical protein